MSLWELPWMEFAVAAALGGALLSVFIRDVKTSFRCALGCTFLILLCAALAWYAHDVHDISIPARTLIREPLLTVDGFSAPLAVITALLYFLTTLATGRTIMRRFSISGSLVSEAIQLATFGTADPWNLVILLSLGVVPPLIILRDRRKPTQVYLLHMALFVSLLILGQAIVSAHSKSETLAIWGFAPLLAAVLIRCGTVPAHCWITDWFERASFGNALLFVAPLTGVYAAIRLVLPTAPDWALQWIGVVSLITAVYAACMATVQREARRFFAYLFLSHASLVLVGMELHTPIALTGALSLWFSVTLALAGLGLTLRALEARFGSLSLVKFHGLYEHSPALAVCFLLTGLASVGFPGTIGFIATEMLVDGAVESSLWLGIGVVVATAMNGIAIVRAYLLLFTGGRHVSSIALNITPRERFAVLTLTALILGAGIWPQPGVASRHEAAVAILNDRASRMTPINETDPPSRAKH
jgi:NADH-quinone oxidoreductase subunit M